jgi:hypothetical protein
MDMSARVVSIELAPRDQALAARGLLLAIAFEPQTNMEQLVSFAHRDEWRTMHAVVSAENPSPGVLVFDANRHMIEAIQQASNVVINAVGGDDDDTRLMAFQAMTRFRSALERVFRS